jgi:hypothetical protein
VQIENDFAKMRRRRPHVNRNLRTVLVGAAKLDCRLGSIEPKLMYPFVVWDEPEVGHLKTERDPGVSKFVQERDFGVLR